MSWYLKNITSEQFDEIYAGTSAMETKELFQRDPETDEDLLANFATSKLWRMNNIYKIVNKDGDKINFEMNWAQHMTHAAALRHPRIIILKSRQQGISTYHLIKFFDDAAVNDTLTVGLMAQGKEEAQTLLERVKIAWENMPEWFVSFIGVTTLKDNTSAFALSNGSTIFIRTSFRSATLQRLHISEFGKIANKYPQKAKETKTGTMQAIKAGNDVAIESTAEGRNMFKAMWDDACNIVGERAPKDFYPLFLSWVSDPDCNLAVPQVITTEAQEYFDQLEDTLAIELKDSQKWWWVQQKRELKEDMGQEYPGTPDEAFLAARDGGYYSSLTRKLIQEERVVEDLHDPDLDVVVSMDLGMNDTMVLGFWQQFTAVSGKLEIRLVDCYYNSGEGLSHYVNAIKDRNYKIARVVVPHDAKVRELGTGKSRLGRLRELGLTNITVLTRADVATGIERVRRMIPQLWIDGVKCNYVLTGFQNYSKQWDEKLGVWKDKPLHDEWSNPMDMVRYYAMYIGSLLDEGQGFDESVMGGDYRDGQAGMGFLDDRTSSGFSV